MRGAGASVSPMLGALLPPVCMSDSHYTTNDPYLASFLLSERAGLAGCHRLAPKRVEFRFVADRHLYELLRLYWSGSPTLVVPRRLFDALRWFKSRSLTQWRPLAPA